MDPSEARILIVDDDPASVELLNHFLNGLGYTVYSTDNGKDALRLVKEVNPNLILLDVMLPGMDGIEVCENIRSEPENFKILIVFLSARNEDYSMVAGLNAGADDYITKPIKPKVLGARIKAILRRYGTKKRDEIISEEIIKTKGLEIDPGRHLILVNGNEITLPRKEFKLLQLLASKPSRVFTRDEIFNFIWGNDTYVGDRTIDVYIRKLREKIGDERIRTIKGIGYKYES